jgi:hypothetical protein
LGYQFDDQFFGMVLGENDFIKFNKSKSVLKQKQPKLKILPKEKKLKGTKNRYYTVPVAPFDSRFI